MSKIIKRHKFGNEGTCKPHTFPDLGGDGSVDGLSAANGKADFEPICNGAQQGSVEGGFEALFQEKEPSPAPLEFRDIEAELAEKHAAELEAAYSRGFVDGEKEGILSEQKKIEPVFEAFRGAILELGRCREALVSDFEKASVELALAIAGKIVCHEVSMNKGTVVDVLKGSMRETGGSEIIKIRISPSDFQTIKDAGLSFPELMVDNMGDGVLESDGNVSSGGCVIETDFACVDARIEHQLEAVEEALRENR